MSRLRVVSLAAIVWVASSLGVGGCAVVRPHERQELAKRAMTADRGKGETRTDQHRAGSREGAEGGTGEPGGGCGCN